MITIIKLPEVVQKTKISRAAIYAMIARGEFPRPFRLGRRAVGWRVEDVEAWIADRPLAGSWTKNSTLPRHPRENRIAERDDQ